MKKLDDFLTAEEIADVRKPLADASYLPPRLYHDPDFYDFEVEKIFMRNWLPVGHVSEIPEPGSYFARRMFNEPILVTRNAEGELKAFANVCRHRTSQIARGHGKFDEVTKLLHCPYHGWGYSPDGELKATPFMSKTNNFDRSKCGLPKLGLDIWQGFILVNMDPDAPNVSDQLATLDKVLEPYNMSEMIVSEFEQYNVRWNWKVTMENFTEGYHQIVVHKDSVEPVIPARDQTHADNDGPYNLFYMPSVTREPLFNFLPSVRGLPEELKGNVIVVNVFPLLHLLIDETSVYWLDWEPKSSDDHDCRWRVLVPKETAEMFEFASLKGALREIIKEVWLEDTEACEGVNLGVRSRNAAIGRPCYMEKSVHQFQNWLVDQYSS